MTGEFSVYQFFLDDSYEQVRRHVNSEEAVKAAAHYTTCVGARIGTTVRVIIVDGGDSIAFEWKYGEGVVFPTKEQRDAIRHREEN